MRIERNLIPEMITWEKLDKTAAQVIIENETFIPSAAKLPNARIKELFLSRNRESALDISEQKRVNEQAQKISLAIMKLKGNEQAEKLMRQLVKEGIRPEKLPLELMAARASQAQDNLKPFLEQIGPLPDGPIKNLIAEGLPLSLENLYKSKFTGHTPFEPPKPWDEVSHQLTEGRKEQESYLRFLYENGLEISDENIRKAVFLKNIESLHKDTLLETALGHFDMPHTVDLFDSKNDISITQMLSRYERLAQSLWSDKGVGNPEDLKTLVARRQIEEIRLMMTNQAAIRLFGKPPIDALPIQEAIETLKEAQRQVFSAELTAAGAEVNTDNLNKMGDFLDKAPMLMSTPAHVYGSIIRKEIDFDVTTITNASEQPVHWNQAQVVERLQSLSGAPSARYGDNFSDVRPMLNQILTDSGFPDDEAHLRAASILSRSGLDISSENLKQIRNLDDKLFKLSDLSPYGVAQLIKKGLDPAKMNIDQLLAEADEYFESFGASRDRIADHLLELEQSGIDPALRKEIFSVYKTLNLILKHGGVALGVSVKQGAEMTLNHLADAARFYAKTGGKGGMVDILAEPLSDEDKTNWDYNLGNINRLTRTGKPELLAQITDPKKLALKDLVAKLEQMNPSKDMKFSFPSVDPTAPEVKWLMDRGLPVHMANLEIAKKYLADPFFALQELFEMTDAELVNPEELAQAAANPDDIGEDGPSAKSWESLADVLDRASHDAKNEQDFLRIDAATRAVHFMAANGQNGPVRIKDELAGLSMIRLTEGGPEDDVTVAIWLRRKGGEITHNLSCKRSEIKETVKEFLKSLE